MYDLQEDFDNEENDFEKLYIVNNTITDRKYVIDYNVEDEMELVSRAKIIKMVSTINKDMTKGIIIDDFLVDHLDILKGIIHPEKVLEI